MEGGKRYCMEYSQRCAINNSIQSCGLKMDIINATNNSLSSISTVLWLYICCKIGVPSEEDNSILDYPNMAAACSRQAPFTANRFIQEDDMIWGCFPLHWPFVRGINRSPVDSFQPRVMHAFCHESLLLCIDRIRPNPWGLFKWQIPVELVKQLWRI